MSRSGNMGRVKRRLVEEISLRTGVGIAEAERIYAALKRVVVHEIESEPVTVIRGVGTFSWVRRAERHVSDGPFGTVIPAYDHLRFKSYGALKRRNDNGNR